MTLSSSFTAAERFESLKAALLGGSCAGIVSIGLLICRGFLARDPVFPMGAPLAGETILALLGHGAIAALSGALFALTYRYAVRQDQNLQLNVGVVLAFTLVRGLAQVDVGSAIAQRGWSVLAPCGESVLLFASTALVLTVATHRHWLQPFGAASTHQP